ncbi:MAG TPA: DoxX family protein [Candidatus Polarisedimenticolaceae bacterium]|nr:DoxX family protein [Candidatus Polarisedimenticolaceae bacterium]
MEQALTRWFAGVESRKDLCFDLLRIYLGIGLFVKGILFLTDMTALSDILMKSGRFQPLTFLLTHYIPLAHIGGGFMMAIGLWTRTAILANIPVLFGAVFFVYFEQGLFTQNQGLEFTALVLFLLIVLLIWGPGAWSVDTYLKKAGPPE